ncbi:MAG: PepSY-associated TM helix domain-containing protein [Acinetobacter sp.]
MKVRSDVIKLAKSMHTWVGVCSGILLFICFFAGGLTMFQHHLTRWVTPSTQVLPPLETEELNIFIQRLQQEYPATREHFTLNLRSNEFHYAPITWTDEQRRSREFSTQHNTWLASLDDQNQLMVKQENVSKLGPMLEQLHETAGIPGKLGHESLGLSIMGIISILYFLALLSGLIVLLPTLIKDFFAIRPGKNKKRFWLDTHNVIGITSLPFHIIISVSVIVFAFHDILYDSISMVANNKQPFFKRPPPATIEVKQTTLDIPQILTLVKQKDPSYSVDFIHFSNLDKPEQASARIGVYSPNHMLLGANQDAVTVNPYNLESYKNQALDSRNSTAEKWIYSMFGLHFGSFGGLGIRWMYVLLGFGGAYLFYSGNILWVETRARKAKNSNQPIQQRKDVRFLANLTIGACLGCILAVSFTVLLTKLLYVSIAINMVNINLFMVYSYYGLFIFCIFYAFIVGASKALPHFLFAIAISLILMPILSLIHWILAEQALLAHSFYFWPIELSALVLGILFLFFHRRTVLRAQQAPPNSIWSSSSF